MCIEFFILFFLLIRHIVIYFYGCEIESICNCFKINRLNLKENYFFVNSNFLSHSAIYISLLNVFRAFIFIN